MNSITSVYITIVATSGALNALLAIYAILKRTHFAGMRAFIGVTVTAAVYSLGTALQLASGTLAQIKFWLSITYWGLAFSPLFFLILVIHYTGLEKWLTRRNTLLLFLIPAITCILVATNDYHHMFYQSVFLLENTPSPMADIVMGPWYIIHGCYTFGTMFMGVCLLVRQWRITTSAYRKQIFTLILGLMVPITASFLYLLGLIPYNMDPVPLVMIATTSMYVWAIRTTDLFNVVPIARGYVFENMRDGVLVLDLTNRLVDYNRAAAGMIPLLSSSSIGEPVESIWTAAGAAEPLRLESREEQVGQDGEWIILWKRGNESFHYEIHSLPVQVKNGQKVGRMLMLIDVTDSIRYQNKLRHLAAYDGLTQIYNRVCFMDEAVKRLEAARTGGLPLSLVLFDIDYFKKINDRYGHHIGDRALVHLVRICQSHLQEGDLFGRYGGEEFVVCLPGADQVEAVRRTEAMRADIAASPLQADGGPVSLTASFGIADAGGSLGYLLENLLQAADRALYEAKKSGRNAVRSVPAPGGRIGALQ
ncbi:MAG: hypothetical protein K0R57_3834 [Paenibacillaceae bacterium]|nr:hypothetical protein [Paenibacillaceae bacterium]